jgi:hypothetical protein
VVYENFSFVYQRAGKLKLFSREEIRRFKKVWAKHDKYATGYIHKNQLPRFFSVSLSLILTYNSNSEVCSKSEYTTNTTLFQLSCNNVNETLLSQKEILTPRQSLITSICFSYVIRLTDCLLKRFVRDVETSTSCMRKR